LLIFETVCALAGHRRNLSQAEWVMLDKNLLFVKTRVDECFRPHG
jgi:hypothetical protein